VFEVVGSNDNDDDDDKFSADDDNGRDEGDNVELDVDSRSVDGNGVMFEDMLVVKWLSIFFDDSNNSCCCC